MNALICHAFFLFCLFTECSQKSTNSRSLWYRQRMGRVITQIKVANATNPGEFIKCDALVDTGTGFLVLPSAWQDRLSGLDKLRSVQVELGDQRTADAEVWGGVRLEIEGFPPIYTEVLFVDMVKSSEGQYEPLIGYIPLEQAQVAVDMLGHRLVPVKYVDMK